MNKKKFNRHYRDRLLGTYRFFEETIRTGIS